MNQFDVERSDSAVDAPRADRGFLQPSDPALSEPVDSAGVGVRRRRRFSSGAVIFSVVAVAAFGSLWSMRAIGRATAATGESSEAGRLVESYFNEKSTQQAGTSARELSAAPLPVGSVSALQVPRERLARDPFAAPWREAVVAAGQPGAVLTTGSTTPSPESEQEARVAAWEALVDEGAHDFVVESVLIAPDPKQSIVSMNGGVFRVGESVMFPDRPIRYEIKSVEKTSIVLAAFSTELSHERIVRLVIREMH